MNIILVDISTILHKVRHSKTKESYGIEIIETINKLNRKFRNSRVIMIQDFGGSRFRKDLYPEYKGHRIEKELSEKEIEELNKMKDWNINLPLFYPFFESYSIFGVEADDLCCILYTRLTQQGYNVIVATQDKDYLGLVPLEHLYNIVKERFYDEEDRHLLSRSQFKLYQGLFGDLSDNIKGVCGEKTAIILASNFTTYTDMRKFDGEVTSLEGVTSRNKRYISDALNKLKTEDGWNNLKLSYKLTSIFKDTTNLNEEESTRFLEIESKILNYTKPSELYVTDELYNFLERMEEYSTLSYLEELC